MSAVKKIAFFACSVLLILPVPAETQDILGGGNPTAVEITMLPKFCWGQYYPGRFNDPRFHIPRASCGVGMNHYCPALVALGRADRSFDTRWKLGFLQRAESGVKYTLTAMERYPRCPIRPAVTKTYEMIERQLSLLR